MRYILMEFRDEDTIRLLTNTLLRLKEFLMSELNHDTSVTSGPKAHFRQHYLPEIMRGLLVGGVLSTITIILLKVLGISYLKEIPQGCFILSTYCLFMISSITALIIKEYIKQCYFQQINRNFNKAQLEQDYLLRKQMYASVHKACTTDALCEQCQTR